MRCPQVCSPRCCGYRQSPVNCEAFRSTAAVTMNYCQCLTAQAVSVLTRECRNLDLRPSFGLTSPPTPLDGCSIRLKHSDTFCSNIRCCITISVMMGATVRTSPLSNIKWQLINLVIAIRAELGAREPSVNFY